MIPVPVFPAIVVSTPLSAPIPTPVPAAAVPPVPAVPIPAAAVPPIPVLAPVPVPVPAHVPVPAPVPVPAQRTRSPPEICPETTRGKNCRKNNEGRDFSSPEGSTF